MNPDNQRAFWIMTYVSQILCALYGYWTRNYLVTNM